ncbi:hypothetical protein K4G98_28125, partial [Mycobacterium tuberculosis]|nr:hypothetical protein [Mycobacterium tuberculosis]
MNRIPASFFVSVAYNCWAYRRLGVKVNPDTGEINEWHYQDGEKINFADEAAQETAATAEAEQETKVVTLQAPITEEQI